MNKQYYVYKTTNNLNNKYYYGVHEGQLDDEYLGSGDNIKKAIKKYGKDNFTKEIIYIANDKNDAYEMESCIVSKELIGDPNCYNINIGGFTPPSKKGKTLTEEHRRKIRTALSGDKNPFYGKTLTEEHRRKISKNSKFSKRVNQYDIKTGDLIKTWESITDAANSLGIHKTNISACCKGKLKTTGNYLWEYYYEQN